MKKTLLLMLCMSVVILSSCWDAIELSEIGLVYVTGFDLDDNGDDRVTVLSVQPFGQGSEQTQLATTWIGTASGKSAFEAMRNLRSISTRSLVWIHNKVIIIGKKKAESGISNIIDLLTRNREIRYDNTIFVTDGTAEQLLQIPADIDKGLPREILGAIENAKEWSKSFGLEIKDLAVESINEYSQGFVVGNISYYNSKLLPFSIDRVEYLKMVWKGSDQRIIYMSGGGVIDNNMLKGWLSPNELRGYLFLTNRIDRGVVQTINLTDFGIDVALEILKSKTEITFPKVSSESIAAEVGVKVVCQVVEIKGVAPEHSISFVEMLEKEVGNAIASEIYLVLDKAQNQMRTDFLGAHKAFSRKHRKEWQMIRGNWCEFFSKIPFTCKVDVLVQNEGLLRRTYKSGGS